MKKFYIILASLLLSSVLNAKDLIEGGNMESGDAWKVLNVVPADKTGEDASVEFGYKADGPSAGKDGCLRIRHTPNGSKTWSNTAVYQKVVIKANTEYTFSAAFKNIDNFKGAWAEFQYSKWEPKGNGEDWAGEVVGLANFMDPTWGSACKEDTYDVLAKDACETATGEDIIIYEDGADGEEIAIYIGIKIGDAGGADALEFLVDEFSLIGPDDAPQGDFSQEMLKDGDMEKAGDWNVLNVVPGDKTGEDAIVEFGYSADGPSAGKGGCFRLTHTPNGSKTWSNTALYQAVTIKANTEYLFSAAFKNLNTFKGAWAEFQYSKWEPKGNGEDWAGEVVGLANFMDPTWGSACTQDTYDVLAKDACETATGEEIIIYEEGADGEDITIYIGIKIGDAGGADALEFLVDEFSLKGPKVEDEEVNNNPNVLAGGDMENADDWNVVNVLPADKTGEDATVEFGYTGDGPSAGDGGCFRLTHTPNGSGTWSNTALYQGVNIKSNTDYEFSAAFKNIETFAGAWAEFNYSLWEPKAGADWVSGDAGDVVTIANFMDPTWGSACTEDVFDVLAKDACETATGEKIIINVPSDEETVLIYIGIKIGDNGNATALEFLVDEFSLKGPKVDGTTVKGLASNRVFSIYPNPVNDQLYFNTKTGIENIAIYNISGQVKFQINDVANSIDVSNLDNGIYFIRAKTKDGQIHTDRFIKK